MGYELHITRRKSWSDTGNDITLEEWLDIVKSDPELTLFPENGEGFANWREGEYEDEPWLCWNDGNIDSKYPPPELIDKMVLIARRLRARVQGDEDEIYRNGTEPPRPFKQSLINRISIWFRRQQTALQNPEKAGLLGYRVGDRIIDALNNKGTIVEIDPKANNNMGRLRVRYDDGVEVNCNAFENSLSHLTEESNITTSNKS